MLEISAHLGAVIDDPKITTELQRTPNLHLNNNIEKKHYNTYNVQFQKIL